MLPAPDEIRAAVERMIGERRVQPLAAAWRFPALRGRGGAARQGRRIKAYTIGVEVLRRDTRFDPQLDPIVRVEATRLRRAIERYYAGPGADRSDHHRSAARLLCADLPAARDCARRARRCHPATAIGRWADSAATTAAVAWLAVLAAIAVVAVAAVVFHGRRDDGITAAAVAARDHRAAERQRCRRATACRRSRSSRCA